MNARLLPSLLVASSFLTITLAAQETAGTEQRITRSAEGPAQEHAADELRDPASFEMVRRDPAQITVKPRRAVGSSKGTDALQSTYGDSWVYEATTDIFSDRDRDGYFSYLRVQFDADTIYSYSYVYAEIYLSADGTAWEHLYSTQDFAIWGSDPEDDYEVETELLSGYSTGLYDVLIELYDADTGELVDEFGPNESPEFSLLPLEDSVRDGAPPPPPDYVYDDHDHDDGGGGAFSWLGLAGLLGAWALRRRQPVTRA
jgi:MYXO-CTERM domain-containing protein